MGSQNVVLGFEGAATIELPCQGLSSYNAVLKKSLDSVSRSNAHTSNPMLASHARRHHR